MHILHTLICAICVILTRRICFTIMSCLVTNCFFLNSQFFPMLMVWSTAIEIHPTAVISIKQPKNHSFLHEICNFPIPNHPRFQQNLRMSVISVHKRCKYYYTAETLKIKIRSRMLRNLIKSVQTTAERHHKT